MAWIVSITGFTALLVWGFFKTSNQKLRRTNALELQALEQKLTSHSLQISYRQQALDRYHFLKYNLSEALQVQPEIKI
ncbi:MAG TPA: hypothetical protein PKW08_01970 [Flavobacteriaceae bacterium]|nr:hypothetical protein [Flavobacteriaceae bacterium]MCB9213021.1 hypothetical protein [Alteromonas sp.]HPF10926.1 hypothetical protein [Flavobacteriaceae bacterium]HQU20332.1 hypothetical protein [Flavobacteriaceae bacterium]HQU64224.1 hypothetical protein [Flavobacteriaceae bacterium]